jgi:choline kinase
MSPLLTPTMPPADPDAPFPVAQDEIPPTVLLRIYGPSSGALISRTEELRILHVLSSQYGLGPKVYGTFSNGRLEQFFPSRALTADELRSSHCSRGIACRMRELHSVDLRALGYDHGTEGEPYVWRCLRDWLGLAKEVIGGIGERGGKWEKWEQDFGLHRVEREIEAYKAFVEGSDKKGKGRVFARKSP